MLLVQHLKTRWDKSIRGAREGEGRRRIPEALSFSAPELPELGEVWLQRLWAQNKGEWESEPAWKLVPDEKLLFRIFHSSLHVVIKADQVEVQRQESSVPIVVLRRGDSAQVRLQGRQASSSHSWFEKHVFNFALLERYDPEVFRLRAFTHTYDDLPDLTYAGCSSPVPARWRVKSLGKQLAWEHVRSLSE